MIVTSQKELPTVSQYRHQELFTHQTDVDFDAVRSVRGILGKRGAKPALPGNVSVGDNPGHGASTS